MAFVQFGALMALVGHTLWIARRHLRQSWKAALRPKTAHSDDFSARAVYLQLFLGLALMTGWFIAIGVPWWAALTFVLMASLTFLGHHPHSLRIGLGRHPSSIDHPHGGPQFFSVPRCWVPPAPSACFPSARCWMSDVRTFVMAAAANGLKLTESIRNKGLVLGSMILAVVLSLGVSVWTTLYYAYESGANNANTWFFPQRPPLHR